MKNLIKIGLLGLLTLFAFSSCSDFFDAIPGERYDLPETFRNRQKTINYLNTVYSYVPAETQERQPTSGSKMGGIWTLGSMEGHMARTNNITNEWNKGAVYAASSWINYWFIQYYKGIATASIFIANVDDCKEANENERKEWKAQARGLRALYYFMLFRSYGPIVLLGEETIPLDASIDDMLKERNSVDECIKFICDEFDTAARELEEVNRIQYRGQNLGRIDAASCKAFKAKVLLYAASPLFNCNPDYADIKNEDGKQLFPQDKSQENQKWIDAEAAYREFFENYVDNGLFKLHTVMQGDKIVPMFKI